MTEPLTLHSHGLDSTNAIASAIASMCRAGDVVVLLGDLGAGKTHFTKAFVAAIGSPDHVTSPTFTLVHEYSGDPCIVHMDLYRIGVPEELEMIGFSEMVEQSAITVIEWGDRAGDLLPPSRLEVAIRMGESDEERCWHIDPRGSQWAPRSGGLRSRLSDWIPK